MTSIPHEPAVSGSSGSLADADVDLIAVPLFQDEPDSSESLRALDAGTAGALTRARARGELTGRIQELFFTDILTEGWSPARLLLIGAGPLSGLDRRLAEMLGGIAGMASRDRGLARLGFVARNELGTTTLVQASLEGALLGAFRDFRFKTAPAPSSPLLHVQLLLDDRPWSAEHDAAVARAEALAAGANLARELSNEPANLLTPQAFGERAATLVTSSRTSVEILDEEAIAREKMGLLLGVSQGSVEPARVIVMRYTPPGKVQGPTLALIGKGVTFDTGGISIKPADSMDRMKRDMAGGAAVIGAMAALDRLQPSSAVLGIVPAAENMPGGRAIRPGDVLTAANGTSVEVLNTDAEGRLILADALTLAQRLGATHLIDIATLTGACVIALGHHASALVGHPETWVEQVLHAAAAAGERVWPLPGDDSYNRQLDSETADVANIGGRPAGAITAGLFLKRFSGELPWAHLDIAGTAWWEEAEAWHPKGATGIGVRTLATLALSVGGDPTGPTTAEAL
ncbi:MAG: leucyl aminopeptidase [Acidobacteria bacterium]|nr:leucyl aminopeptidase [Acidobacteriota bacterium]